jgi:hypothetical protein
LGVLVEVLHDVRMRSVPRHEKRNGNHMGAGLTGRGEIRDGGARHDGALVLGGRRYMSGGVLYPSVVPWNLLKEKGGGW